jgi:hypothetical protein
MKICKSRQYKGPAACSNVLRTHLELCIVCKNFAPDTEIGVLRRDGRF